MIKKDVHWENSVVFFVTIASLFLVIYSLYFGVAPMDEALYVGIPYRFILGDRPFIDECNQAQMASFFILPFIQFFIYLKASTEGIILFARYLHFVVTTLLAILVFFTFKKITRPWAAMLSALPCIIFVPYNLHGLSYDTLALTFQTAGYCFGLLAVWNNAHRYIFCAGICLISAAIAYPPLLLIPLIYLFCLLLFLPKLRTVFIYSAGVIIGAAWFFFILIQTGWAHILIAYHFVQSVGAQCNGLFKVYLSLQKYGLSRYILFALIGMVILSSICIFILRKKKNVFPPFLVAFLLQIIFLVPAVVLHSYLGSALFLSGVSVILPPILFLLMYHHEQACVKQLFFLVWLPALIAGLIVTWASSNNVLVSAIGTFPGALAAMVLASKENVSKQSTVALMITPLLFIGGLHYFNLTYTYQDLAPASLHYKLNEGPFKGIYTTQAAYHYYTQLGHDIKQFYRPGYRVLFFDNFPLGYLYSDMRPATNNIWLFSSGSFETVDRYATIHYLTHYQISPDLIFKMLRNPDGYESTTFKKGAIDPIDALTKQYHLVLHRNTYEIYQKAR